MLYGNALVAQSGGPTAAINATLAGIISAVSQVSAIEILYGARNGLEGVLKDNIINLDEYPWNDDKLTLLQSTPASALGSCRLKLPEITNTQPYYTILETFQKYNIRYFFYIGGNDSMDAVHKIDTFMKRINYDIRVIGVPKTIDNDLMHTHHTPGYGSAAKYIGVTMQEILRDAAVYTIPAVTIVEIMGRDAGWLAAAASLPRVHGDGPDYIYLPEVVFDVENVLKDIEDALSRHPNVVIALAEGVKTPTGAYLSESESMDAFGHKSLSGAGNALERVIQKQLHCKTRVIELNTLQRCASHCASRTDIDESKAIGMDAVRVALNGISGEMVGADTETSTVPAAQVANIVRSVPVDLINDAGNNVTDEMISYIMPLIEGEVDIQWSQGLPMYLIF